jgi:hypothetical protein
MPQFQPLPFDFFCKVRDEPGESRWDHESFTWQNPNRNDSWKRTTHSFAVKSSVVLEEHEGTQWNMIASCPKGPRALI